MMVLMESAWKELFIGGQFVIFDNFWILMWKSAAAVNLATLVTFLTCFWPRRSVESCPIGMNIRLIDRARWELSKTPPIVLIGLRERKISSSMPFWAWWLDGECEVMCIETVFRKIEMPILICLPPSTHQSKRNNQATRHQEASTQLGFHCCSFADQVSCWELFVWRNDHFVCSIRLGKWWWLMRHRLSLLGVVDG